MIQPITSKATAVYLESSRGAKRGVIMGTSAGLNLLVLLFFHDVLGKEVSLETAAVVGGLLAGAVSWVFGGGLLELLAWAAEIRREARKLFRNGDE